MSGYSKDTFTNDYCVFLVKVDLNGNIIWSNKYFTGTAGTEPRFVSETSNGDLLIAGRTYDFGVGDWDIFIAKFSSTGNFIYGKTWGGLAPDEGYSIFQTQDGGNIICSEPESITGKSQATLIKTNSQGNSIWMKSFGKPTGMFPFGSVLNTDKGFTIFGIDGNFSDIASIFLTKTDSLGNSSCEPQNVNLTQTSFTLAATPTVLTNSLNASSTFSVTQKNIFLLSTDICDNILNVDELHISSSNNFFPNPFSEFTNLILDRNSQNAILKIYNIHGLLLKSQALRSSYKNRIDRENLPSGMYYATIHIDDKLIKSLKLIITD